MNAQKNNQQSLYSHINSKLTLLMWIFSSLVSVIIAITVTLNHANKLITTEARLLNALATHIASLVNTNDRTEIMRLLSSSNRTDIASIEVVVDDLVYANSEDISKIDLLYTPKESLFEFNGSVVTSNNLIVKKVLNLNNQSNGMIIENIPLKSLFPNFIQTLIFSFFLSISLIFVFTKIITKQVKKTFDPLKQLQEDIKNISDNTISNSNQIYFIELDEIRETIFKAKKDLIIANEFIANQRAKEINAEIYRRLIHDLQNPITALKTMASIAKETNTKNEIQREALESMPLISDEILSQIKAAKKNFEFDSHQLKTVDLRDCIQETLVQIYATNSNAREIIKFLRPKNPIYLPCDSSSLKRAIINLLENSLEACKKNIEIKVDQNQLFTSIFINDDGSGIKEKNVNIFLDGKGVSSKGERQALGLSSTNHIAKNHRGRLLYQKSNLGGAGFELRLGEV